jgi:hypothetical protein
MLVYEILGSENIYCNSKMHNLHVLKRETKKRKLECNVVVSDRERKRDLENWGYCCDSKRSEVCVSSFGVFDITVCCVVISRK